MTGLPPGLYIVATPIGNLGDLSERAARVLREATVVAAEDTRTSRVLLTRAGSTARMVSLTEHNVEQRAPELISIAREGIVALVSDAGTPVIADPGARLVEAAHASEVTVLPVPGASALAAAVSVSGFEGSDVHFLGFLPKAKGERTERLRTAGAAASVLVFFESPGRLAKTLLDVAAVLGNPETVVCREMTKLHEEVVRGRATELAARFTTTRGECTVVVRVPPRGGVSATADVPAEALLAAMKRAGGRRSTAAAEVSRLTGQARDELYALWDSFE